MKFDIIWAFTSESVPLKNMSTNRQLMIFSDAPGSVNVYLYSSAHWVLHLQKTIILGNCVR